MSLDKKRVSILGTRGIPAKHGGFETFAERLAHYLQSQGWHVTVYCQSTGNRDLVVSEWNGIMLITIGVSKDTARSTIDFDWKSMSHAVRQPGVILTLGYNTAFLGILCRWHKKTQFINMDGVEWKRKKWSFPIKAWFYINEKLGRLLGNYLIADHPEIAKHLRSFVTQNKISTIAYGADCIENSDIKVLEQYQLETNRYCLIVARPEPENSILEMVLAFSRKPRGFKLVVLGDYNPAHNPYHRQVQQNASSEVIFTGAIFDKSIVSALRFYACCYLHGHQVGGTNPSLVEALGAGSAVIAHNNKFNYWVAQDAALYFTTQEECELAIEKMLSDTSLRTRLKTNSLTRHRNEFTWAHILKQYEQLLENG